MKTALILSAALAALATAAGGAGACAAAAVARAARAADRIRAVFMVRFLLGHAHGHVLFG